MIVSMQNFFRKLLSIGTPRIFNPVLGQYVLPGDGFASLASTDLAALGSLFTRCSSATDALPLCDVLLIYCEIDSDGDITGLSHGLREIISASCAAVVIVAKPNSGDAYMKVAAPAKTRLANLVLTIDRKHECFRSFFFHLFEQMQEGISMPQAWVKLAPQDSRAERPELPATIFACERGQLAFG